MGLAAPAAARGYRTGFDADHKADGPFLGCLERKVLEQYAQEACELQACRSQREVARTSGRTVTFDVPPGAYFVEVALKTFPAGKDMTGYFASPRRVVVTEGGLTLQAKVERYRLIVD